MTKSPKIPRISLNDLEELENSYSPEVMNDYTYYQYKHAGTIISRFLGVDWAANTFAPDAPSGKTPLTFDYSSHKQAQISIFRFLYLAEALFNLQNVEGFDDQINRMKVTERESGLAEFNVAGLLFRCEILFKFNKISGVKGLDYDFKIIYPDSRWACVEAKCRVQSAAISPAALKNPLKNALRQLPKKRPGIIFITLPYTWFEQKDLSDEIYRYVRGFLNTTKRIVAVVFYAMVYGCRNGVIVPIDRYAQITNNMHRFDNAVNWTLNLKDSSIDRHSTWHRIFQLDQGNEKSRN